MKIKSWDYETGITWEYLCGEVKLQRGDWWKIVISLLKDRTVFLEYKILSEPEGAVAPPCGTTHEEFNLQQSRD